MPPPPPPSPFPASMLPPAPLPGSPIRPARPPKRRNGWRIALACVGGLILVSAIGGAVNMANGTTEELPTFVGFRPVYGTSVFAMNETYQGSTSKVTVTSGSDTDVIHMEFSDDSSTPSVDIITDGATAYVHTPASGQWVHDNFSAGDAFGVIAAMTKVSTFDDWVPDAMRPFVEVTSKSDRVLDGKTLQRYELVVHESDMKTANPVAYKAWTDRTGTAREAADNTRLVLWVDDDGVVWQLETWSDLSGDRSSYKLVSMSDDDFVPPYPTTYLDMLADGGPKQVGAEQGGPEQDS
jgi:hypothetical protein